MSLLTCVFRCLSPSIAEELHLFLVSLAFAFYSLGTSWEVCLALQGPALGTCWEGGSERQPRQNGLAGNSASFSSLLGAWEEDGDSDGRSRMQLLCQFVR